MFIVFFTFGINGELDYRLHISSCGRIKVAKLFFLLILNLRDVNLIYFFICECSLIICTLNYVNIYFLGVVKNCLISTKMCDF